MTSSDLNWIASYILGVADDMLRDRFVRSEYCEINLPMILWLWLDAVLEPKKLAVFRNDRRT